MQANEEIKLSDLKNNQLARSHTHKEMMTLMGSQKINMGS